MEANANLIKLTNNNLVTASEASDTTIPTPAETKRRVEAPPTAQMIGSGILMFQCT